MELEALEGEGLFQSAATKPYLEDNVEEDLSYPGWLTMGQLEIPRQHVSVVVREDMCQCLDEEHQRKIILLTAPAGFGKTTLLTQFADILRNRHETVSWLTIDNEANDPHVFVAYLVFSLAHAGVSTGHLLSMAEENFAETSLSAILTSLLKLLANHPSRLVMILDDYHQTHNPDLNRFLTSLITNLPPNIQIIMSVRERPEIDLPRFFVSGHAIEFNAEKLRLTENDIRRTIGAGLDKTKLELVTRKTEGWPVAVQLARILLDSSGANKLNAIEFSGDKGHVATYLANQVLAHLPKHLTTFLIQTSAFETFNASLANVVCDFQEAGQCLSELEVLQPLVTPLYDRHQNYRCHPLFREYLHNILQKENEAYIQTVHDRASRWYEDNNMINRAVRHASLSRNYDRCARLIEKAGGWELVLYGGTGLLQRLMQNIPHAEYPRFPRLQLARAYLLAKAGNLEQGCAILETVEADLDHIGDEENRALVLRDYQIISTQIREYADRCSSAADLEEIRNIKESIPETDHTVQGTLGAAAALTAFAIGRFTEADSHVKSAIVSMRRAESVLGLIYCYIHAGLRAFYVGNFQLAMANFEEALEMADDNYGAESNLKFIANIYYWSMKVWLGEEAQAEGPDFFAELIKNNSPQDSWFETYAMGITTQMESYLLREKLERAAGFIQYCDKIAMARNIKRLTWLVKAYQLRTALAGEDSLEAARRTKEIEEAFVLGEWKSSMEIWRPYYAVFQALSYYKAQNDLRRAIEIQKDLIDLCQSIGAVPFLITSLVDIALMYNKSGQNKQAAQALSEAASYAAPQNIIWPFIRTVRLVPLLRGVLTELDDGMLDTLTTKFIRSCVGQAGSISMKEKVSDNQDLMTPRELEVLVALSEGLSNKEIARRLSMTGHTVKFHLRNIFDKLAVVRRGQAVEEARKIGILI